MQHIILQTSDTSSLTIEPQKTIFWVGAGVGGLPPCNLPLGNGLTDAVMEAALGEHNKEIMIDIWETKIPKIRDGVRNIDHTVSTRHSGIKDKGARPRLEFIIGELHKLDIEFQNIRFQKDFNKVKYQRPSVVKSLQHFSSAAPNIYHYALADFARNGAEIITTNFDICIEKALTGLDTPPAIETPYGIKAIKYGDERFVYHVHGIATDKNIENNLGATLTNVSKSLSKQFTNLLLRYFEDGYTIVFIGYGGVDFFDIKPFFDCLPSEKFPGKAIYLHYCSEDVDQETIASEKNYQYLLKPFQQQIICYGCTEKFLNILMGSAGIRLTKRNCSMGSGRAFEDMKQELTQAFEDCPEETKKTYWFLNTFRIASQLSLNPGLFYPDWAKLLAEIYSDWSKDAPEQGTLRAMINDPEDISKCVVDDIRQNNWYSFNPTYRRIVKDARRIYSERGKTNLYLPEVSRVSLPKQVREVCQILDAEDRSPEAAALECAVIQFVCGPITNSLCKQWLLNLPKRKKIERELSELLRYIDQLLQFSYNHFSYMSFYLSLCRKRHLLNTILEGKEVYKADDFLEMRDSYNSRTKTYGDLQNEWDICMEIPNLFDSRRILQGIYYQYIYRIARIKSVNFKHIWHLGKNSVRIYTLLFGLNNRL